jgi:F-type H+-transporting ATPase subunit gamma
MPDDLADCPEMIIGIVHRRAHALGTLGSNRRDTSIPTCDRRNTADPAGVPRPGPLNYRPMAQIREIKKRMTAVKTIQRITKTMQMIATAKFTAAVGRAKATRPYTDKVQQLVGEVAAAAGEVDNPLIDGPAEATNQHLVLVISSDRGLCGAYNGHVLRTANTTIREMQDKQLDVEIETSGKKAVAFFRFQKLPIAARHTFGDKPAYEDVERLASDYIERFIEGKYDTVSVTYMRFISNSRQVPETMQLLPIKPPTASSEGDEGAATADYDFSPTSGELLNDLLPMAVKTALFQAFNDAVVSEQIMRMVAMKAATENAKDLGRTLKRDFNRARQSQITTELTEIIAGAAALE